MVGYGLGVGAAGNSSGGLKKTGRAVGKRFETLPVRQDQAGAPSSQFVGPPSPRTRDEHELPVDFHHAAGVVRLYTRWTGPADSLSADPEDAAVAAGLASLEPVEPPSSRPWGEDWIGATRAELSAALGKPILAVAGGGGPDDSQLTFKLPDGTKARFLVRSDVVVSATRY